MTSSDPNNESQSQQIAATLWALRFAGETVNSMPAHCHPNDDDIGRQAQLYYPHLAEDTIAGWKIAATSKSGQEHIGVQGPLEGPYLSSHIYDDGAILSMTGNHMAVAEAEFAFRFGQTLEVREQAYSEQEVLVAVASLHPSLELPDSRISDYPDAGPAVLLADCACGRDWVLGAATRVDWRSMDLAECPAKLIINDATVTEGKGADALGHPVTALTWLVNKLCQRGIAIQADQVVTTGVCGKPQPVKAGDRVVCDLGVFGTVGVQLTD